MRGQRLDKWLWCARLVRTRSLAVRLIAAGRVRVNGERTEKPSRQVRQGDIITAALPGRLFVVRVLSEADKRGAAPEARLLYEDLTPPVSETGDLRLSRRGPRPSKRDRRRIDALRVDFP